MTNRQKTIRIKAAWVPPVLAALAIKDNCDIETRKQAIHKWAAEVIAALKRAKT